MGGKSRADFATVGRPAVRRVRCLLLLIMKRMGDCTDGGEASFGLEEEIGQSALHRLVGWVRPASSSSSLSPTFSSFVWAHASC